MRLKNATPNPVSFRTKDGFRTLISEGFDPHVRIIKMPVGTSDEGITIYEENLEGIDGLPPREDGTLWVVSSVTKEASERDDLVAGVSPIRGADRQIVGMGGVRR